MDASRLFFCPLRFLRVYRSHLTATFHWMATPTRIGWQRLLSLDGNAYSHTMNPGFSNPSGS